MENMGSSSRSVGGTGASGSNDSSLHGLKFGKKIYFEDVGSGQTSSSSSRPSASASSAPALVSSSSSPLLPATAPGRRGGRGAEQQPPRCQVEGCGQDLTGAKAYYCRHKVCGTHSKSPKVIVAGIEQRFCQQCSRFHQLPEFDQGKRSCRRRLAGHNERRRKPPAGPFASRYGQPSSSYHEDCGRFGGFVMDFSCPRLPGPVRNLWPTNVTDERLVASDQWPGHFDMRPTGRVTAQVVTTYGPESTGEPLFSGHEIPSGERLGVPDSSCALSLLSTQSWGTNTGSSRDLAISVSSSRGIQMVRSPTATRFLGNPWGSSRHESSSSSSAHGIMHDTPFGQSTEPIGGQFSSTSELDPSSNRQCLEHGRSAYGDQMHWPR